MSRKKVPIDIRFWRRVNICGEDECWPWIGYVEKQYGYGRLTIRGKAGNRTSEAAHRLSYMINCGDIPDGLFVCHTCDNRACVNPKHLYLGTPQDNSNDMKKHGMLYTGENHPRSKLKQSQVDEIRKNYFAKECSVSQLSKKYQVSIGTIYSIINYKTWVVKTNNKRIQKPKRTLRYKPSLMERLMSRVEKISETGCWEWTGPISKSTRTGSIYMGKSYGKMGNELVYRASWILHNGSIANGLHVLHKCHNRICVNPSHLELGTNDDNISDRVNRSNLNFLAQHCSLRRGTFKTIDDIVRVFSDHKQGMSTSQIAEKYCTNRQMIWRVLTGRHWSRKLLSEISIDCDEACNASRVPTFPN